MTGQAGVKRWRAGLTGVLAAGLLWSCSGQGPTAAPTPTQTVPGKDTTAPAAPSALTATPSAAGVALDWADNGEDDLAGYKVSRASSASGPYTVLTPELLTVSSYSDASAPVGATSYYRVVAVDKSGNASGFASVNAARPGPKLTLENLDVVPYPDRLVFSRIGSLASPPANIVHDTATVRLHNEGDVALQVSGLGVNTGDFVVDPPVPLPAKVDPGKFLDVRVKFVAQSGEASVGIVHAGNLTITSNAATAKTNVQLAGVWQSASESDNGRVTEPSVLTLKNAFGYNFDLLGAAKDINQDGLVRAQGDEVLSAYWQRADATQPVVARQLAAYHTQNKPGGPDHSAPLYWYAKGSGDLKEVLNGSGFDGQTVLPHSKNSSSQLATGPFTPSATTFGFKVDYAEWSDPTKNDRIVDVDNGCAKPCGQHVRFWPLKDRDGAPIPNTYFMVMDYSGVNYDYNDNVYIVSNVKPAPVLINVGGPSFPANGDAWQPDKDTGQNGYVYTPYSPDTAISEPATAYTGPISGTNNPKLYQTYRGNVGAETPQNQRVLTYKLPVNNGVYSLKLHFVDQAYGQAGKRVFDVSVQNEVAPRIANLDIAAQVGRYAALVKQLDNVQVTDGFLTIALSASVDFPAISGIEILR